MVGERGVPGQLRDHPARRRHQLLGSNARELEGRGGLYLEDCGSAELAARMGLVNGGYAPRVMDPERAARLWARPEDRAGECFAFA